MIVIAGTLQFAPEHRDALVAAFAEVETATQAESGNLAYNFWESHTTPGEFLVFEKWENEEALNAHMASPHMAAFLGAVGSLGFSGASIDRYDIAGVSKFM